MISSSEFKQRRKRLMRRMKKGSIAVLASAPAARRNRDTEYPYRQNSDFHYLSGFDEPSAVIVLAPNRDEGEFVLFCREFDPNQAIWTGKHAGLEGAMNEFGANQAFPIDRLDELLPGLLDGRERVYYAVGEDRCLDEAVMEAVKELRGKVRAGAKPPTQFMSLDPLLHEMRLRKSEAEIRVMRRAAEVSATAHRRAMQICRPGLYEYQVEAELLHEFARHGLRHQAYPAIVAGGENACVLHYTHNGDILRDGDLLLIDAGAECECYASDITRTFPVNGRFTEEQRAIYSLTLEAQSAAIKAVRPGKRWIDPHEAAVRTLVKGLVALGLLKGRVDKLIEEETYKKFYMHRTGHWLGMDVHDVGDYKIDDEWRTLEEGMVLTVEPGLYISSSHRDIDAKWHGIGIRIEDDVLVTKDGCEVLTAGVPKSIEEIEALMRGSQ